MQDTETLHCKPSLTSLASTQPKNQTQLFPRERSTIYHTVQRTNNILTGEESFHNCQFIAAIVTILVFLIKEIATTHHF